MIEQILQDGLFAAIAAIGFASISRPPRRAYPYCALIAAAGHAVRYMLLSVVSDPMHIVPATLVAAFTVGALAVFLTPFSRTPAETCLFPALLPMIPGIYAYKAFGGLAMCILSAAGGEFDSYFSLFAQNGITCLALIFCLVLGGTIPTFMFKKLSFQATRRSETQKD